MHARIAPRLTNSSALMAPRPPMPTTTPTITPVLDLPAELPPAGPLVSSKQSVRASVGRTATEFVSERTRNAHHGGNRLRRQKRPSAAAQQRVAKAGLPVQCPAEATAGQVAGAQQNEPGD